MIGAGEPVTKTCRDRAGSRLDHGSGAAGIEQRIVVLHGVRHTTQKVHGFRRGRTLSSTRLTSNELMRPGDCGRAFTR